MAGIPHKGRKRMGSKLVIVAADAMNRGRAVHLTLALVAALVALGLVGLPARGNFVFDFSALPIVSGANAGKTGVILRAFNDGLGGTGTKLVHVAVRLESDANLRFRFANLDPDNVADADVAMSPGYS